MSCVYCDCHAIYDYMIVCFLLATGKDSAYNNVCRDIEKTCSHNFEDTDIPSNIGLFFHCNSIDVLIGIVITDCLYKWCRSCCVFFFTKNIDKIINITSKFHATKLLCTNFCNEL